MTTKLTAQEKLAISILDLIQGKAKDYFQLNSEIRKLQGDFAAHVQLMDPNIETQLVGLLDSLLGDELASYYLFEASTMKDGGAIFPRAKAYPELKYRIKTKADMEKYLQDRRATRNFTRNLKLILNRK